MWEFNSPAVPAISALHLLNVSPRISVALLADFMCTFVLDRARDAGFPREIFGAAVHRAHSLESGSGESFRIA